MNRLRQWAQAIWPSRPDRPEKHKRIWESTVRFVTGEGEDGLRLVNLALKGEIQVAYPPGVEGVPPEQHLAGQDGFMRGWTAALNYIRVALGFVKP